MEFANNIKQRLLATLRTKDGHIVATHGDIKSPVNKGLNCVKGLSCHSRHRTEDSQAPMISVTHYMDREGNFLATVSPRRYFCNQCHVTQVSRKPLVENEFKDVRELIAPKPSSH